MDGRLLGSGHPLRSENQQFTAVPNTNVLPRSGRGHGRNVWVASNGPSGVVLIERDSATVVQFHSLNPCSTPVGVSVDTEGFVWVVDQDQGAWKIDPVDPMNKQFLPIAGYHYTYSDITGGQISNIIIQ